MTDWTKPRILLVRTLYGPPIVAKEATKELSNVQEFMTTIFLSERVLKKDLRKRLQVLIFVCFASKHFLKVEKCESLNSAQSTLF